MPALPGSSVAWTQPLRMQSPSPCPALPQAPAPSSPPSPQPRRCCCCCPFAPAAWPDRERPLMALLLVLLGRGVAARALVLVAVSSKRDHLGVKGTHQPLAGTPPCPQKASPPWDTPLPPKGLSTLVWTGRHALTKPFHSGTPPCPHKASPPWYGQTYPHKAFPLWDTPLPPKGLSTLGQTDMSCCWHFQALCSLRNGLSHTTCPERSFCSYLFLFLLTCLKFFSQRPG